MPPIASAPSPSTIWQLALNAPNDPNRVPPRVSLVVRNSRVCVWSARPKEGELAFPESVADGVAAVDIEIQCQSEQLPTGQHRATLEFHDPNGAARRMASIVISGSILEHDLDPRDHSIRILKEALEISAAVTLRLDKVHENMLDRQSKMINELMVTVQDGHKTLVETMNSLTGALAVERKAKFDAETQAMEARLEAATLSKADEEPQAILPRVAGELIEAWDQIPEPARALIADAGPGLLNRGMEALAANAKAKNAAKATKAAQAITKGKP